VISENKYIKITGFLLFYIFFNIPNLFAKDFCDTCTFDPNFYKNSVQINKFFPDKTITKILSQASNLNEKGEGLCLYLKLYKHHKNCKDMTVGEVYCNKALANKSFCKNKTEGEGLCIYHNLRKFTHKCKGMSTGQALCEAKGFNSLYCKKVSNSEGLCLYLGLRKNTSYCKKYTKGQAYCESTGRKYCKNTSESKGLCLKLLKYTKDSLCDSLSKSEIYCLASGYTQSFCKKYN